LWVHSSYDASTLASNRIDLGMIELVSAFTISSNVTTITMCSGSTCGATGSQLYASGYGQTQSDVSSSISNQLRFAGLLAVSGTACAQKFAQNFGCSNYLPATNICAQSDDQTMSPAKGPCFSDFGGPLVQLFNAGPSQTFQLVGVASSTTVPASRRPSCGVVGE